MRITVQHSKPLNIDYLSFHECRYFRKKLKDVMFLLGGIKRRFHKNK